VYNYQGVIGGRAPLLCIKMVVYSYFFCTSIVGGQRKLHPLSE